MLLRGAISYGNSNRTAVQLSLEDDLLALTNGGDIVDCWDLMRFLYSINWEIGYLRIGLN